MQKTIFSVPSRETTKAAAAKAAKEDVFQQRHEALTEADQERILADKYDLLAMWRQDPALFPIEVTYWGILIEMVRPTTKYGGILEKHPDQIKAEEYLARIGRVIGVGPAALAGKTESGIDLSRIAHSVDKPDDLLGRYVLQVPNTGMDVWFAPLPGKKLKIISNTEIAALVGNPTMFLKP